MNPFPGTAARLNMIISTAMYVVCIHKKYIRIYEMEKEKPYQINDGFANHINDVLITIFSYNSLVLIE